MVTLKHSQKLVRRSIQEFTKELSIEQGERFIFSQGFMFFYSLDSMEKRLIRAITTIGEVIQFSPALVQSSVELVDALKTIMASEQIQNDNIIRERGSNVTNVSLPFLVLNSAIPSLHQTLISRPPTALNSERNAPSRGPSQMAPFGISQPVSRQTSIGGTQPSQNAYPIIPPHYVGGQLFTSCVRAYCVLALGKFCLMVGSFSLLSTFFYRITKELKNVCQSL